MKTSDYFNSIEEIKEFVKNYESTLPSNEYIYLLKLMGLGEQEGDFEEVPGIGKIDKSIVEIIVMLNKINFITLSSCSGIRKEHSKWSENNSGYISFYDDKNTDRKKAISNIAEKLQFQYDEEEVFLKPAYTIRIKGTDEYKVNVWNQFKKCVKENLDIDVIV